MRIKAMACAVVAAFTLGGVAAGAPVGDPSVVQNMPGLVAFWTFGEAPGQARQSTTAEAYPLSEVNGPIPRVEGGPYSGYSMELNGTNYLELAHEQLGALNISGPTAQVSMFAVVKIYDVEHSRTIAGIWSEGKGWMDDSGTRQYALLAHMPAYGGARRLTPHISSEGGMTRRADGTPLDWNADYAAPVSDLRENEWITVGFTYDSQYIRAYVNGVMEERKLEPVADNRNDPYFTQEGPNGGDRGMNPYYHGRGIYTYDPNDPTKMGPSPFTVGARHAEGQMLIDAFRGLFGGLAVFDRALTDEEMLALHYSSGIPEPSGLAVVGLAALTMLRRKRA